MNNYEIEILLIAAKHSDPEDFLSVFEKRFQHELSLNAGWFFQLSGGTLAKASYFHLAIRSWEQALRYYLKIADTSFQNAGIPSVRIKEAECCEAIALSYSHLCEFSKALAYFKKALKIVIAKGDRFRESACCTNIGITLGRLGDFTNAISFFERSLKIKQEIGDQNTQASCLKNMGLAYLHKCSDDIGLSLLLKALQLKTLDKHGQAGCCVNIGIAYSNQGDFTKAIEYYNLALPLLTDFNNDLDIAACYENLGLSYAGLKDFEKASECYSKALEKARTLRHLEFEKSINFCLAKLYSDTDNGKINWDLAYDHCKKAIQLSDKICQYLVMENHLIYFREQQSDIYQLMIQICLKLGKNEEAFEFLEGSKCRAFLNLLATSGVKPSAKKTSKMMSLQESEERIRKRLLQTQTFSLDSSSDLVDFDELEKTVCELNAIYQEMEKIDPNYISARKADPISLNGVKDLLLSQKKNVVLAEYFTTKQEVFIFVISSKDLELRVKRAPLTDSMLINFMTAYLDEVAGFPIYGDRGSSWMGIGDFLIKPICDLLRGHDLIYFVPHGLLHFLPLHSLEADGAPLIKSYKTAYCPSSSVLKYCSLNGTNKLENCVSFGVCFGKEAEAIGNLFEENGTTFSEIEVTKNKVLCNLDKDIIHFSCHGYFSFIDPLSSGIRLYDGNLTAREIFQLKFNAELVTLSACQTGMNLPLKGDELIGLTRALFHAGAPSVIVSLWSVYSPSTQELMLEFYENLRGGVDKATALQKAQLKIMEQKEYSHPYYWAPFVLIGKC